MVTDERLRFTFSLSAPVATKAGGTTSRRRVARRTVRTMQVLLDHLPPAEVELICARIERTVQQIGDEQQDAIIAQMTGGRTFGVPEQIALELGNLERHFRHRRELLAGALSASEVAQLLGTTRQTPHDRVAAGTMLAVRDQGALRFPAWQFDPQGPHGVVAGLADVLRAFHVSPMSQASWLTRPNPHLGGVTPMAALRRGEVGAVTRLARSVGVS